MSLEDEPGPEYVLDALEERPLDVDEEVRHLHEITDRLNVDPEALFQEDGAELASAIRIVDRLDRRVYLYGYSPAESSWVLVEEWAEEEISPEDYLNAADAWIDRFGRERIRN